MPILSMPVKIDAQALTTCEVAADSGAVSLGFTLPAWPAKGANIGMHVWAISHPQIED